MLLPRFISLDIYYYYKMFTFISFKWHDLFSSVLDSSLNHPHHISRRRGELQRRYRYPNTVPESRLYRSLFQPLICFVTESVFVSFIKKKTEEMMHIVLQIKSCVVMPDIASWGRQAAAAASATSQSDSQLFFLLYSESDLWQMRWQTTGEISLGTIPCH